MGLYARDQLAPRGRRGRVHPRRQRCEAIFVSAGVRELAEAVRTDGRGISARYAFGGHVDGYGSYAGLLAAAGPP